MRKNKMDIYALSIVGGGEYDEGHIALFDSLSLINDVVEAWCGYDLTQKDICELNPLTDLRASEVYLSLIGASFRITPLSVCTSDKVHFVIGYDGYGNIDSVYGYIVNIDEKKLKEFMHKNYSFMSDMKTENGVLFDDICDINDACGLEGVITLYGDNFEMDIIMQNVDVSRMDNLMYDVI